MAQKKKTVERLLIKEMSDRWHKKNPKMDRIVAADIGDAVFVDAPKMGDSRKRELISRWNNGFAFGRLTPWRLRRIAKLLECTVDELISKE